jgi:hypothetical protein
MSSVRINAQRFLHDLFSDCQFQQVSSNEQETESRNRNILVTYPSASSRCITWRRGWCRKTIEWKCNYIKINYQRKIFYLLTNVAFFTWPMEQIIQYSVICPVELVYFYIFCCNTFTCFLIKKLIKILRNGNYPTQR